MNLGLGGDADLSALIGEATNDAAVLEFDFVPTTSKVTFQYVFGSEEYTEYVYSFNDVFAFFVNGTNRALLPDGVTPVSIDNVNGGKPLGTNPKNADFYVNNDCNDGGCPLDLQADGKTIVLTLTSDVKPNETNHVKLAIADAVDHSLDSWVLLKASSLQSVEICDNGIDDDGDGLVDQNDPDCHVCGDGNLDLSHGEQCDDGNTVSGDGCSQTCQLESCGNNVLDPLEECDDGNNVSGDGCQGNCQLPKCGDSVIDASLGEQCDDGNTTSGDGCSATCQIETGGGTCGDGEINQPSEQCDDGNTVDGDGCSAECKIEKVCGDGSVDAPEECDDGGTAAGDGCSATCTVEPGYACAGAPSVCTPVCGDGIVAGGESCDDGNTVGGDCCSATCQLESCRVATSADSFLRLSPANSNEGANTILSLRQSGKHRPVLGFDLTGKNAAAITSAKLVLSIKKNRKGWDGGRSIEAHALLEPFAEGNGVLAGAETPARGSGAGVTWNCAADSNIANPVADCNAKWGGGNVAPAASDAVTLTNATSGEVAFDVTADVKSGTRGWLVKKTNEAQRGAVLFRSREGAAAAGDPTLAPRLELSY